MMVAWGFLRWWIEKKKRKPLNYLILVILNGKDTKNKWESKWEMYFHRHVERLPNYSEKGKTMATAGSKMLGREKSISRIEDLVIFRWLSKGIGVEARSRRGGKLGLSKKEERKFVFLSKKLTWFRFSYFIK